jgi:uncharacterized protein YbjT (DUF2867 family)
MRIADCSRTSSSKASVNAPPEVEVVEGDLARPESLAPALEGVKTLHLITHVGPGYTRLETGDEIVAKAKGVEYLGSLAWGAL